MKKIKYILSAIVLSTAFFGCDDDLADTIDESAKPRVTFTVSSSNAPEIDTPEIIISIKMDKPIKTTTTFAATQIGGDAVLHEDYEVSGGVVPAYQTEGEIVISVNSDLDVEGDETAQFEVGAAAIPDLYEVIGTANITLTIEDYEFCLWNLVANDSYGDGWNGGFISVEFDGTTSTYAATHPTDTFDIPITKGSDYTITYVSGGGTGQAPGWEEENSYVLTAPDGTVFADGSGPEIPTAGVITSGTSTCN
ncbi:hypothetical protein GCM10023311_09230 [Flaviramulus aquimarinus]|uniref:Calx-beta domain-containing protein n=1 Tax=Flaviramulus aquimarinus TaxID=1170456 RepID=A0ABP9EVY3_9FLAO